MTSRKRNPELVKRLLLLFVSLVLSVLMAEFGARLYFFGMEALSYRRVDSFHEIGVSGLIQPASEPELVYEFKPNLDTYFKMVEFKTNSKGLRDREWGFTKDSDTFRVAVVGDSYTMPAGVKLADSFHKVLERRLNDHTPKRQYEFLNFGVGGYSLRQYAAVIEYKALRYNPDLILIGFCSPNDHIPHPEYVYHQPYRVKARESGFFQSYLLRLLNRATQGRPRQTTPTIPQYSQEQIEYMASMFRRIREQAQSIPVVVALLSTRHEEPGTLRGLVLDAGLHFVDASLSRHRDHSQYVIHKLDAHPNARANRAFADVIYRYLTENRLVP